MTTDTIDTGHPPNIADGDFRRAAALVKHFLNNNLAGLGAVTLEAEAVGRTRQLNQCTIAILLGYAAGVDVERANVLLDNMIARFSVREWDDPR